MERDCIVEKYNDEIQSFIENEAGDEDYFEKTDIINYSVMLKSIWEGRKGTIYFQTDKWGKFNKDITERLYKIDWTKKENKKYTPNFKAYRKIPYCLSNPMKINGIERTKVFNQTNIIWKFLPHEESCTLIRSLNKFQKFNHFPTTLQLGRKDYLWQNYKKFNSIFKEKFSYISESFLLPKEKNSLIESIKKDVHQLWVVKPILSSKSKGIKILTNIDDLPKKCLVSKYIKYPFLINERKFDLKLFVLVTSFTPLKIMIFKDGIVRFAMEKYNLDNVNKVNKYVHFTNFVNSKSENDNKCKKWSLTLLRAYFINNNIEFEIVYEKIKDLVIKSIITIFDKTIKNVKLLTKHKDVLFELLSFDLILDEQLSPFLVEINVNPSMNCDSDIDLKLKTAMITDVLNIVGLIPFYHKKQNKNDNLTDNEGLIKNVKQPKTLEQNRVIYNKKKENKVSKISNFPCEIVRKLVECNEIGKCIERRSQSNNDRFKNYEDIKFQELISFKRKFSMGHFDTKNKNSNLENNSTLNSSVSTTSFISNKMPSTKFRICKEFENNRNFKFNSKDYINEYQEMLMDTYDQFSRLGNFELLFPLAKNIEYYSQFIKEPKDDNIVLWKWLMSGKSTTDFKNTKILYTENN